MSDPLQALLQGAAKPNLFPPNSRYYGIDTSTLATAAPSPRPFPPLGERVPEGRVRGTPNGRTIVYLRRRFIPPPEQFALLQEYTVIEGDRIDNLAAKFVGDPERFWQLCDANVAMSPEELTEIVGRILRITLPAGIPGNQNG